MSTPEDSTADFPPPHPCRERIHRPLSRVVELLAKEPTAGRHAAELVEARLALNLLERLVPSAKDVLSEFTGPFGRVESICSEASREGRNSGKHVPQLTRSLTERLLSDLRALLTAIAPTSDDALMAIAGLEKQVGLVTKMIDSAQKEGWKHGDYRTAETDDAVAAVAEMVQGVARY